jgi:hypothetical protein
MRAPTIALGVAAMFASLLAVGCVSARRDSGARDAERSRLTREPARFGARSDVLTLAELIESRATSTGEAVRRVRPEFLRPTSLASPSGVVTVLAVVYVNDAYAGGPDMLSTIPLGAIEEIRFVTAAQAHDHWGSSCTCRGGVIHVRTKR